MSVPPSRKTQVETLKPSRKIPHNLRQKLLEKFNELEENDII